MINTKKRVRRTAEDIEKDILNATGELIREHGFGNITISAILEKAKIEPNVFYKRFRDLDNLLDKYVRPYDYWLNDSFNFDSGRFSAQENCENLLVGLVDSLNSNEIMQKLLAWEVNESHYITERTASNRERHSHHLLNYFKNSYSDPVMDIHVISALMIGGIYYLTLHRRTSTFCDIDFNTPEGISLLKNNIREIVRRIYQNNTDQNKAKDKPDISVETIAKSLIKQGVDQAIIRKATGLTQKELLSLS